MDLKRLQAFEGLVPTSPGKVTPNSGALNKGTGIAEGPSFQETLDQMGQMKSPTDVVGKTNGIQAGLQTEGIKFSNHAIDRMRTRGITFSPESLERISNAVAKAAAKGSKDSLILMDDSALIVSVKNKTVVTVMDKAALKENVFTNIDSTIVM